MKKETHGIQSISLDARNGPSQLSHAVGHFYPVGSSLLFLKKWATKESYYKVIIAAVVAVYNLGFPSMIRDLHCTELQATIGMSVFTLGFGVVPLVTSSFSEEFGRLPLYIVSGIGFFLMFPMIALYVKLRYSIIWSCKLTLRFLSGHITSRQLLWLAFYKALLALRLRLWLEEPSQTYGRLRSMYFLILILPIKL